jgi:hypothetical protein
MEIREQNSLYDLVVANDDDAVCGEEKDPITHETLDLSRGYDYVVDLSSHHPGLGSMALRASCLA